MGMQAFCRILLALAHHETDASLIAYGRMLARMLPAAEFDCVHVTPGGGASPAAREALTAHIRQYLGDAWDPGRFRSHALDGVRLDRLLQFSADHRCDLILLGHRRDRGGRRSLARRLAMKAPCSVWLAPEGSPAKMSRILAPVDFSARSADALDVACRLAASAGSDDITALHVYFNDAATIYDDYGEALLDGEASDFHKFLARIDLHGVDVLPVFVESAAVSRTICRVASERDCDLIVMGTRGRTRSAAVLLGSETEHVIMNTEIPVLAVKHFGAELRLLRVLLERRFQDKGEERYG